MSEKRRGRKPIAEEPANEIVRVRVTSAQRIELRRVASENGCGMSGVIREAVNEYVSDYRERGPFRSNKG